MSEERSRREWTVIRPDGSTCGIWTGGPEGPRTYIREGDENGSPAPPEGSYVASRVAHFQFSEWTPDPINKDR